MFTLVFFNDSFNRPNVLNHYLHSNVGNSPLLRIDCLTPYNGTEEAIVEDVCAYLNGICSDVEVSYNVTQNVSMEEKDGHRYVNFIVIQIRVTEK